MPGFELAFDTVVTSLHRIAASVSLSLRSTALQRLLIDDLLGDPLIERRKRGRDWRYRD